MNITDTEIDGVKHVTFDAYEEVRGNIWTTYKKTFFMDNLNHLNFNHDKFSVSNYNVFRGFHGDLKTTKMVTCVYGQIIQFVLDWRKHSSTFGKVLSFNIDRENKSAIIIPPGCGNGYYVKSDQAVYHYKLSYDGDYLDADEQFTVSWRDPQIKNFDLENFRPILSERDQ